MYKLKIQNYDQQYLWFNSLGNILNVLSSVLCLIFKVEFKFEEELLLTCIEYSLLCSYFTTNVILFRSSKTIMNNQHIKYIGVILDNFTQLNL